MIRGILGAVAGIAAWFATVFVLGLGLRYGWPDYAAAAKAMALPMMAARLGISFIGSLIGGYLASTISRERMWAALGMGIIMLAWFVPYHLRPEVWHTFPIWYHLTFFVSLPVLSLIGGRFAKS
jgi:hypothetical protein